MIDKTYLGDSVFVHPDPAWPEQLVLTTDNGYGPNNRIIMEPEVIAAFISYVARMQQREAEETDERR